MMRIITGTARGTKLRTLEGEATRPTTERVKEAVFSMIQFEIEGTKVLDVFGGSGQLALEALSRGADSAVICDNSPAAVAVIKENAQKTHLYDRCVILNTDATKFAARNNDKFDVVFIDPPYASGLALPVFESLVKANAISDGGLVICETDREIESVPAGFRMRRHAEYSRTHITVFEKVGDEQ